MKTHGGWFRRGAPSVRSASFACAVSSLLALTACKDGGTEPGEVALGGTGTPSATQPGTGAAPGTSEPTATQTGSTTTGAATDTATTTTDSSSSTSSPPMVPTSTAGGAGGAGGASPGAGGSSSSGDDASSADDESVSDDGLPQDDGAVDDTSQDDATDDAVTDDAAADDTVGADDTAADDSATDDTVEPPLPTSDCQNGEQDGAETGPDCGGGCEAACVAYELNQPNPDNENRSGCEANGNGFMCPRAMVFSSEMVQAAIDDWGGPDVPFVYGVVGHDPDPGGVDGPSANYSSTCCQCYQLVFKHPTDQSVSIPTPKPMIVQAFNTYAGGPTAFDIYMAVGGHGNFNGCTENGRLYQSYPDTGGDWSGGVRATRYGQCQGEMGFNESSVGSQSCQDFVANECSQITANEPIQSTARQSCVETNRIDTHYHVNWEVMVQRVECPEGLTRVTGCRLGSQGLPEANPALRTQGDAQGAGFRDGYHTTTMEDCCRPTCAWPTNVTGTTDGWSRFYVCDANGNID